MLDSLTNGSRWQGESGSVWDPYRSWGVGDEVRGAMDPTLINVERLTVLTVCRKKERFRDYSFTL